MKAHVYSNLSHMLVEDSPCMFYLAQCCLFDKNNFYEMHIILYINYILLCVCITFVCMRKTLYMCVACMKTVQLVLCLKLEG